MRGAERRGAGRRPAFQAGGAIGRWSPARLRPCGPPLLPRKSLLLQPIIHIHRKRGSRLGTLPEPPGSPETERATAGTSRPPERTGRQDPGPRAAPEGAADGTYRTSEPPPDAPPSGRAIAAAGTYSPATLITAAIRPVALRGATFGATVGVAEVNPPFRYDFRYPAIANVVHESRWRRCGWSPAGESTLRLWGVEWGWERPPSDPRIYGPDTRSRATTSATGRGSLPARACGAIDPCGKASGPARGGSRRRPAEPP